jgi:hypothetical protein
MSEQEFRNTMKMGIKSPSNDFTERVMGDISTLKMEVPTNSSWNIMIILVACCVLLILSIFVRIPEIEFFNYTIEFPPLITPILTLIFLFVVLQQVYDLSNRIKESRNNNLILPTV